MPLFFTKLVLNYLFSHQNFSIAAPDFDVVDSFCKACHDYA